MKRLLFVVLFCLLFAFPSLAQDIELTESYTNESGELTFSHPAGWEVDDQDFDVYLIPDAEAYPDFENVSIVFAFLTEQIANALGITSDMSGEEAMGIVAASMGTQDGITISDIELGNYGENQTATIELEGGGEFLIASVVESSGGVIMVRLIGSAADNTVAIDTYYDIIASTVLDLDENIISDSDDEEPAEDDSEESEEDTSEETDTGDSDSSMEMVELSETFDSFELGLSFNYPDGWAAEELFGDVYVGPDLDEELGVGFIFLTEELADVMGIDFDMGAEEVMQILIASPDMGIDLSEDDIVVEQYGENTVATIETDEDGIGSIVESPNGLLLAQATGSAEEVSEIRDIYFAMLASLVLQETLDFSENFTSESDEVSFNYPDGWEIEDEGTDFIIIADKDAELDDITALIRLWTPDVEENLGIAQFDSAIDVANLYASFGEEAELEIVAVRKLNVGDYIAASLEVIESEDSQFYGVFIETDEGLIMAQITGPADQVAGAKDIVLAMIASLEYAP